MASNKINTIPVLKKAMESVSGWYFYRFIPRHADELELDVDDPLFVEEEEDDYWYRGYNMRTGARGIFPAYYAHEVIGQTKDLMGKNQDESVLLKTLMC